MIARHFQKILITLDQYHNYKKINDLLTVRPLARRSATKSS